MRITYLHQKCVSSCILRNMKSPKGKKGRKRRKITESKKNLLTANWAYKLSNKHSTRSYFVFKKKRSSINQAIGISFFQLTRFSGSAFSLSVEIDEKCHVNSKSSTWSEPLEAVKLWNAHFVEMKTKKSQHLSQSLLHEQMELVTSVQTEEQAKENIRNSTQHICTSWIGPHTQITGKTVHCRYKANPKRCYRTFSLCLWQIRRCNRFAQLGSIFICWNRTWKNNNKDTLTQNLRSNSGRNSSKWRRIRPNST